MNFSAHLLAWYSRNGRNLPWRVTRNPYHVWISEIILQQTRMVQGLVYFNRFTQVFPDVYALAKASEREVLRIWQGLGYYSRARHLHKAARLFLFLLRRQSGWRVFGGRLCLRMMWCP